MSKWITVPRQLTDEMFNVFSREIGPLPEQYARITKAWYLAVHAAPMPPAPPPEGREQEWQAARYRLARFGQLNGEQITDHRWLDIWDEEEMEKAVAEHLQRGPQEERQ
jgi:hypothetical protein